MQSFLLIFVVRPFDIGDRIETTILSFPIVITKVYLFTSVGMSRGEQMLPFV